MIRPITSGPLPAAAWVMIDTCRDGYPSAFASELADAKRIAVAQRADKAPCRCVARTPSRGNVVRDPEPPALELWGSQAFAQPKKTKRHPRYNHQFSYVLSLSRIFMGDAIMNLDDRVLRRLKLSDLRLFHAVVQWGGMAKAATHLSISQPAVSKAIAGLEHTLGVRLLERSPQGVEPTIYGRALLEGSIAVFDELKQSVKQIEFLSDPTAGELRIGCTEPLAAGFVPAVIEQLSRSCPRLDFHIITADPVTLTERELRQRKIDLAIAPTPGLHLDADIDVEILFDDRQLVMAATRSKWVRQRHIQLANLVREPWISPPPDSIIGASIAQAFRESGLEPPHAQMVSFSIPLCHHLLASGRFLIMLPVSMAHLGKHLSLKVLRVEFPGIPRPTGIMTLKNRTLNPMAKPFIDYARKVAKPLPKAH